MDVNFSMILRKFWAIFVLYSFSYVNCLNPLNKAL